MSDQSVASTTFQHGEFPVGLPEIEAARRLLSGESGTPLAHLGQLALHTPLIYCESLSQQLNCRVWLKLENLQRTGSYKVRGAFNNVANLTDDQRERGLITASAGNHAQGVGLAAATFGIAAQTTIFVPVGTPRVKQDNTRAFGVDVREVGETFDQAREAAYAETAATGKTFIEPFDDWHTIAGQGTIGLEIAESLPSCRAIIAPIGGGGLISGIALAAEAVLPMAEVLGAQAAGSPAMIESLIGGLPVPLPYQPTTQIADGIKVSKPGDRTFAVVRALIGPQRIVAVPDIETVAATADLMVYAKVIAEGAGAISVAALREIQLGRFATHAPFRPDDDIVAVISGGNIDPSFSWRILYEQTVPNLMTVRVAMPDRPGELLRMLLPIAKLNVNIIDVDVNRLDSRPRIGERIVELCVAVAHQVQADSLIAALNDSGYRVLVSRWQDPSVDKKGNTLPSVYAKPRTVPEGPSPLPSRAMDHVERPTSDGAGDADVLIVNKKHRLPRDYQPEGLRQPDVSCDGHQIVCEPVATQIEQMFREASADGVSMILVSGYRSWQLQCHLFEKRTREHGIEDTLRYLARPGFSEHQTGLAVDLSDATRPETKLEATFAGTAAGEWLAMHAHRFGFHLRYPEGGEPVTGYAWEPWHFRFVGARLATLLKDRGQTLEEYFGVDGGDYHPVPDQE